MRKPLFGKAAEKAAPAPLPSQGRDGGGLPIFAREFGRIYRLNRPPEAQQLQDLLGRAQRALDGETDLRPPDNRGLPGGVLELPRDRATLVLPDLHARREFLLHLLLFRDASGTTAAEKMAAGRLQVVCVGDGFHAEGRAADRWKAAFREYTTLYKKHQQMDAEMTESLGLMALVMLLKGSFPREFHFLKGNHENILNENENGNRGFGKFAREGEMVKAYMEKFYPEALLPEYHCFEHSLPLLAAGDRFAVTHAEPARFHPPEELINYRENPEAVYDLTWTADDAAEPGAAEETLHTFLGSRFDGESKLIGGHRPVRGLYHLRAEGRYVQIHNPGKYITAVIRQDHPFVPEKNILELRPQPETELLQRLENLGEV